MSEYIGARISLVSKSEIRYVGTLDDINSETHTVALIDVTSHGTEGRRPGNEMGGADHVFEYIVFRGSDVKELKIVAPPGQKEEGKENEGPRVPDDPAILGSARPQGTPSQQQQPPQQQQQQNQFPGPPQYPQQQQFGAFPPGPPPPQFQNQPPRFQGPGGPHGFPGAPGAVPGYGMNYGPPGPPPPGYGMGYGPPPPGHGFPHQPPPPGQFSPAQTPIGPPGQQRPPQHLQGPPQPPIGSKQGTPQPAPGQAPQPPSGPAQQQKPVEMSATATPAPGSGPATSGPPPPMDSKPPTAAATAPSAATQAQSKPAPRANMSRVAVPLPPTGAMAAKPPQKPVPNSQQQDPTGAAQPQTVMDATQKATAAVAAAMAKLGTPQQQQMGGSVDNLTNQVNQMRVQDGQFRGRGRGRGGPRGGRRDSAPKTVEVPKEDYDFESANAKFNKEDLVKQAIASGSPVTSPTNGAAADPIAATNGRATSNETEDVVIPGKQAGGEGYNKKSSFFDNISSDLKDRVEQQSGDGQFDGRAMRREERTRNMETFGQGSVDGGYRGGFRGRGRGRGFGRGGGFRGGRGGFEARGRGRGGRDGLEGTTQPV